MKKTFVVKYIVICEGEFTIKAKDEDEAREAVEDLDYDELASNAEDVELEIKGVVEE